MKNAIITGAVVVGMIALFNQFDATKQLLNGGNRYFN